MRLNAPPPPGRNTPRWLTGGFLVPLPVFFREALGRALAEPTAHRIAAAGPVGGRPDDHGHARRTHHSIVMVVTKLRGSTGRCHV